ncbi:MAG: hypothetical protein F6K09_16715, partial [Merismopedia sp. SIO2A8]|nr:hypothetical protein [Merismopedia sp. SIO2A8]
EILNSLTFGVSATCSQSQRQWSTPAGDIQVTVNYYTHPTPRLRIEVDSPCAGQLSVQGSTRDATTHRDDSGCMSVELFDVSPQQTYRLIVQLADRSEQPFAFSIQVEA